MKKCRAVCLIVHGASSGSPEDLLICQMNPPGWKIWNRMVGCNWVILAGGQKLLCLSCRDFAACQQQTTGGSHW